MIRNFLLYAILRLIKTNQFKKIVNIVKQIIENVLFDLILKTS